MSFAAAADVLRISRPSLWQQVRALEEELGAELLRTESQQISLTEDGLVLLELVTPLVESFDAVRSIFADRRRDLVRRLNVATTSSLLANELQRPVRLYAEQNADVRFSFVERPSKEALPLLESGVADLAIVGMLDDAVRPGGFEYDDWVRYPFALVCPRNHTMAKVRHIALEDIVKHPLLLPTEATNARQRVDAVLRGSGLLRGIHGVIESSTALVLARYVEMGLGIALCS